MLWPLLRQLSVTVRSCGVCAKPWTIGIISDRYLSALRKIYAMEPKKAIVIYETDCDSVDISFRYVCQHQDKNVDRIFNLKRKKDEALGAVLGRISTNITKVKNKKKKKKGNEDAVDVDVDISVDMVRHDQGTGSSADPPNDLPCDMTVYEAFVNLAPNNTLVIDNIKYMLDLNPPVVKSVDFPKCIMAGFPICISKLVTLFSNKCNFRWFKSDLKFETIKDGQARIQNIKWVQFGEGYYTEVTNEAVGCMVKVIITPFLDHREGGDVEVVSPVLVSAGPGECPFERRHQHTTQPAGEKSLRVISYNILADLYADSNHARTNLFGTCPPYAIDIDYRKQLLTKELLGYNGDLICLQEVDEKVFKYDLQPALSYAGFQGFYDAKGGQVTEGLSIFFRESKLRILERNKFILSTELQENVLFSDMWKKVQSNDALKERVSQRTTALQVSVLESVEDPSRLIVVGITHLYFHPDADHIRILQGGMCMELLKQVISLYQAKNPEIDISLLFCGDFNSTPEFGIYRFMTTQLIATDDVDWTSCPEECVKDLEIRHDFEMESACGLPEYTNYTCGFYGCLDYIFYQTDKFLVKKVIPMPSHEEVIENVALPSIKFPSDHIPLIADLEFKTR